ncbi:MAG: TolC family protein [Endomicrobium sp.]|jgi:outer membrane protein TolC|nr:TolC family protein [Endomicrobium sp.]
MKQNFVLLIVNICRAASGIQRRCQSIETAQIAARRFILFLAFLLCGVFLSQGAAATSLSQYQTIVEENNGELKEMRFSAQAAKEKSDAVFTKFFPSISIAGAIFDSNIINGFTKGAIAGVPRISFIADYLESLHNGVSVAGISVAQPVFMGGKIYNANKLAKTGAQAAGLNYEIKKREVYAKAQAKYYDAALISEEIESVDGYQKTLNSLLETVEQAFAQGTISKSDLLRVKFKKEETDARRKKLERQKILAFLDLKTFAGIDKEAPIKPELSFGEILEPDFNPDDFNSCLQRSSEYNLLLANANAAKFEKNIEAASYLPSLAVGASFYRLDYFYDNDFSKSAAYIQDSAVYAAVKIPISAWWEGANAIKEKNLKYKAALEKLKFFEQYLILNMHDKYDKFKNAYEHVNVMQSHLNFAKANADETKDKYDNGIETLANYLEALALQQEIQAKSLKAKAEYFKAETEFLNSISSQKQSGI